MNDDERIGTVWIDGDGAVIGRWEGEPAFERIESGVPPRRRAVGSVRRGPARPAGGGRVGGHGTEDRHAETMRRFFATVADAVSDLDAIEVSGRGPIHERFATLLADLSKQGDGGLEVTVRPVARRPTPRQMAARLRSLAGEPLPRRTTGPYRPAEPARDPSGRKRPFTRDDLPNRRRRHLPERTAIDREVAMMLADDLS